MSTLLHSFSSLAGMADDNGMPLAATAMRHLSWRSLQAAVERQLAHPWCMQQGRNGTCGAAVIAKYMVEHDPKAYADTLSQLYATGRARHGTMTISLPPSMSTMMTAHAEALRTTVADLLFQGALTYRANLILRYDPVIDGQGWRSFMWPTFFGKFLHRYVGVERKKMRVLLLPSAERLAAVDYERMFVIGMVHHNGYHIERGVPNHYVQIAGCQPGGTLDYWTWGERHNRREPVQAAIRGVYWALVVER